MAAQPYATTPKPCPECGCEIVKGAPIARLGFKTVHRGCATPQRLRRPARQRLPYPTWARPLMLLTGILAVCAALQTADNDMISVFGAKQATAYGVPAANILGHFRDPIASLNPIRKLAWTCDGLHRSAAPTQPPPTTPGHPQTLIPQGAFVWGGACDPATNAAINSRIFIPTGMVFAIGLGLVFCIGIAGNAARGDGKRKPPPPRVPRLPNPENPAFHLYIGHASGRFTNMGHTTGIAKKAPVVLVGDDCSQNIVIFGGIGSGKTVYAINRFAEQALAQDAGLLVFDVKGDYGATVLELAAATGRKVTRIGIGGFKCNLLAGLTPETAASFLKSAILLAGNTGGNSAFWTNTATELVTATLGLLQYFPDHYSLLGLYQAIYTTQGAKWLRDNMMILTNRLEDEIAAGGPNANEARTELIRIRSYQQYINFDFPQFDDKVQDGAKSQLSQVIRIFSLPEIDEAFCQAGENVLSMQEVLDGGAFVLDLPLAKYGLGAKTVYTMVKLRFFNVIERRRVERTWNQDRPVVFLCDEYQELISVSKEGLSDRNFWDKSRSARCIGIISGQGFESFTAAVGDEKLTKSLLQNFRQKIAFRTEDEATVRFLSYVLGSAEVEVDQYSENRSRSLSPRARSQSRGMSQSSSIREEAIINPQTVRQLDRGQAIVITSIDGAAYDDIVQCPPRFINSGAKPRFAKSLNRGSSLGTFLRGLRFFNTAQD